MGGFGLERMKFGVYVLVPVIAVLLYNQPWVYETSLKSHRYVVYQPTILPPLRRAQMIQKKENEAAAAAMGSPTITITTSSNI